MTRQITVRLPDDVVDFIDTVVEEDEAPSRAAVVTRALQRERRRDIAARDARILSEGGTDDDLDGLARFNAGRAIDVP
ncbi:MAG: YlcI/YnfO family protein [Nocardioidaceae bacterium]